MILQYINWNPNQTLLHLGPVQIRYYSLLFMICFYVAYRVLKYCFIREDKPLSKLESLMTHTIVGTLLGARLGHVIFYDWGYFKNHLLEILLPFRFEPSFEFTGFSGLASHGAIIGIIISTTLFMRKNREFSIGWLLDVGSLAAIGGSALVRLGNFMNSEIKGKIVDCSYPTAIRFIKGNDINTYELMQKTGTRNLDDAYHQLTTNPSYRSLLDSIPCRHPAQLYEMFFYIITFIILINVYNKTKKYQQTGFLFGLSLVLMWSVRFFVEFVKESQGGFESALGILSTGQWLSLPLILFGFYLMFFKHKSFLK